MNDKTIHAGVKPKCLGSVTRRLEGAGANVSIEGAWAEWDMPTAEGQPVHVAIRGVDFDTVCGILEPFSRFLVSLDGNWVIETDARDWGHVSAVACEDSPHNE